MFQGYSSPRGGPDFRAVSGEAVLTCERWIGAKQGEQGLNRQREDHSERQVNGKGWYF